MARIELKDSGVLFNEELHEYWYEGKQLHGITDVIQRQLFPDSYSSCPEHILRNSAKIGTQIHKSIQNLITDFEHDGSVEVEDFVNLTRENHLTTECSEYNVSDLTTYSSNIDVVFRESESDSHFSLGDIKSSKLTPTAKAKARWQLSIYAYLFELQNKKCKVDHLYILNIRNKEMSNGTFDHVSQLVEVDRIPSDIVKELLDCDLREEKFHDPFAVPTDITEKAQRIKQLLVLKSQAEEEIDSIKADILSSMEFLDVKTWQTEDVRFTRKLPSQRTSFDLHLFKAGHPEIQDYDQYMRTSQVSGSLMVNVA